MKKLSLFLIGAFAINSFFAQSVNQFTGDFSYSLPLMSVPSKDGNAIPISVSYSAGISPNASSSWVGLGWNLGAGGEITRNIQGAPDDWKGKMIFSSLGDEDKQIHYWGPIHFKDFPTNQYLTKTNVKLSMDMTTSPLRVDGNAATGEMYSAPDYDQYFVSGPNIGGQIKPYITEYGRLIPAKSTETLHDGALSVNYSTNFIDPIVNNGLDEGSINNFITKRPTFHFIDDKSKSEEFMYENTLPFLDGSLVLKEGDGSNDQKTSYRSSNYIEYFLNSEIQNAVDNNGLINYSPLTNKSMSPHSRGSLDVDFDGIGAFKVTTPSGMVYHYALPVYVQDVVEFSYALDDNFTVPATAFPRTKVVKESKYAVSWKLTTITGPYYKDSNNNGVADEGDKGYWVNYSYDLDESSFQNIQSPSFGFNYNKINAYFKPYSLGSLVSEGISKHSSSNQGSYSNYFAQLYYINKIETSTHSAHFLTSARKDILYRDVNTPSNNVIGRKLDKIVLTNNGGDPTNTNDILSSIEFLQNYELSKGNYQNVDNTFSVSQGGSTWEKGNNVYYYFPDWNGAGDYYETKGDLRYFKLNSNVTNIASNTEGGKLTLKGIRVKGLKGNGITPDYTFDYGNNKLYSPNAFDMWGNYKNDYSTGDFNRYITLPTNYNSVSKNGSITDVDAWSLTKINTPLGGELEIEYEPDTYTKVGYENPRKTYKIESAVSNGLFEKEIFDDQGNSIGFNHFPKEWDITLTDETMRMLNSDLVKGGKATVYFELVFSHEGPSQYNRRCYSKDVNQNRILQCEGPRSMTSAPYKIHSNGFTSNVVTVDMHYSGNQKICGDLVAGCFYEEDIEFELGHVIVIHEDIEIPGGGLRVKEMSVKDENGVVNKTKYTYHNGNANYEPDPISMEVEDLELGTEELADDDGVISDIPAGQKIINQNLNYQKEGVLIAYSDFGGLSKFYGAPNVAYEKVDVETIGGDGVTSQGKTTTHYSNIMRFPTVPQFKNGIQQRKAHFDDYGWVDNFDVNCMRISSADNWTIVKERYYNVVKVDNHLDSKYGRLLKQEYFDVKGTKVGSIEYEYYDGTELNYPGTKQEAFFVNKFVYGPKLSCTNRLIRKRWSGDDYGLGEYYWYWLPSAYIIQEKKLMSEHYEAYIHNYYPTILKSKTTKMDGTISKVEFLEFNEITGEPTLIKTTGAEGSKYEQINYAYERHSVLGSKFDDYNNINLLYAKSDVSKYRPSFGENNVGALQNKYLVMKSASLWKDSWNTRTISGGKYVTSTLTEPLWRPYKSFAYKSGTSFGDNTIDVSFDSQYQTKDNNWEEYSKINLVTNLGLPLETENHSIKSAVKYGYGDKYSIASCSPSSYVEFTHCSAEYLEDATNNYLEGEVALGDGTLKQSISPHTGSNTLELRKSEKGFIYEVPINDKNLQVGKTYKASVWVHKNDFNNGSYASLKYEILKGTSIKGSGSISYDPANSSKFLIFGDWVLLELLIEIPTSTSVNGGLSLKVYCEGDGVNGSKSYFDDFRFQPLKSVMGASVYDDKTSKLVATLNDQNFATEYVYDDEGRIKEIWIEERGIGKRKLMENEYNLVK